MCREVITPRNTPVRTPAANSDQLNSTMPYFSPPTPQHPMTEPTRLAEVSRRPYEGRERIHIRPRARSTIHVYRTPFQRHFDHLPSRVDEAITGNWELELSRSDLEIRLGPALFQSNPHGQNYTRHALDHRWRRRNLSEDDLDLFDYVSQFGVRTWWFYRFPGQNQNFLVGGEQDGLDPEAFHTAEDDAEDIVYHVLDNYDDLFLLWEDNVPREPSGHDMLDDRWWEALQQDHQQYAPGSFARLARHRSRGVRHVLSYDIPGTNLCYVIPVSVGDGRLHMALSDGLTGQWQV